MANQIQITGGGAVQPAVATNWLYEVQTALEARHWIVAARLAAALERETLDDETARAFAAEISSAQTSDAVKPVDRYNGYVVKRDAVAAKVAALDGLALLVEARIKSLKYKQRDLVVHVLKIQIAQLTDAANAHTESREVIVARRNALLDELHSLEPTSGARARTTAQRTAQRRLTKGARTAAQRQTARKRARPAAAKPAGKKRARRARQSAATAAPATP
jgi:hypothetical protein